MPVMAVPMRAWHRPIKDFAFHIWEDHVYDGGDTPDDVLELATFHRELHWAGIGHKDEDESHLRVIK